MYGKNEIICIAGKNQCSIDFLKFTAKKIKKRNILVLPNKSDKGEFAKKYMVVGFDINGMLFSKFDCLRI